MKMVLSLTVAAIFTVAGCVTTSPEPKQRIATAVETATPLRIATAEKFRALVVGKLLSIDENSYTFRTNGTLDGTFGGKPIAGTWEWKDGYLCRQLTTHSKNYGCQLWTVSGNQHIITRDKGKGKSFVLTVK